MNVWRSGDQQAMTVHAYKSMLKQTKTKKNHRKAFLFFSVFFFFFGRKQNNFKNCLSSTTRVSLFVSDSDKCVGARHQKANQTTKNASKKSGEKIIMEKRLLKLIILQWNQLKVDDIRRFLLRNPLKLNCLKTHNHNWTSHDAHTFEIASISFAVLFHFYFFSSNLSVAVVGGIFWFSLKTCDGN